MRNIDNATLDAAAATVQATLFESDGATEVTGQTWPATMTAEGSGNYRAILSDQANLIAGQNYIARIVVDDGPDRHAEFNLSLVARRRGAD